MIGFTDFPPLSVSGSGFTSHVLKRRLPFLTHAQDGLTRRLRDEMRGGSRSKRLVPGRSLKEKTKTYYQYIVQYLATSKYILFTSIIIALKLPFFKAD